nr:GFA family protein [uncultured Dongia sp.]
MSSKTGGCQCGAVRYELRAEPLQVYVCHCRECRKQSASAFGISVIMRSSDVKLVSGDIKRWSRPTDSGATLHCFFCPLCGSRVFHGDRAVDDSISVKGGSLDEPPDLAQAHHIWTSRKLSGIIIPGHAEQFEEEP